jgi:hypothetical protein
MYEVIYNFLKGNAIIQSTLPPANQPRSTTAYQQQEQTAGKYGMQINLFMNTKDLNLNLTLMILPSVNLSLACMRKCQASSSCATFLPTGISALRRRRLLNEEK